MIHERAHSLHGDDAAQKGMHLNRQFIVSTPDGALVFDEFAVMGDGTSVCVNSITGEFAAFKPAPADPAQPRESHVSGQLGETLSAIECPTLVDRFALAITQGVAARRALILPSDESRLPADVWLLAQAMAAARPEQRVGA